MQIYQKLPFLAISFLSFIVSGCASTMEERVDKALPLEVKDQLRVDNFSVTTSSTQRSTIRDLNELGIDIESAYIDRMSGFPGYSLVIKGEVEHTNPQFRLDSEFISAIEIRDLEKVSDSSFVVTDSGVGNFDVRSVHNPVESRINSELKNLLESFSNGIITGTVFEVERSVVDRYLSWSGN